MIDLKKVESALNELTKMVLKKFEKIQRKMGGNFNKEMSLITSQDLWNGKSYGGYYPEELNLAGGMSEHVLQNIFYHLGIPVSSSFGNRCDLNFVLNIYPLVLREAMKKDKDLNIFIRSLISGAEKIGLNFKESIEFDIKRALLG